MKLLRRMLHSEWVATPLLCVIAGTGGFLLSSGTVSGIASPLSAAVTGVCHPLYGFCVLLGGLLAYILDGTQPGMQYLLSCLVAVVCARILFHDSFRPHVLAAITAVSCAVSGFALDLVVYSGGGKLPLYLLEAVLTGIAAYFIADGYQTLRAQRKISLNPGRRFTFSICYLLCITALCGADLSWLNLGRMIGLAVTMLCARQFEEKGGTLCGALTACGAALYSVKTGMPMLFLPVTAMLSGFLTRLPQALWIPLFFVMQILSAGVLDGSKGIAKTAAELFLACGIYALSSNAELCRLIAKEEEPSVGQTLLAQQEQMLGAAVQELREETSAVMQRLTVAPPADAVSHVRDEICADCKNCGYCWKLRQEITEKAFCLLLHEPEKHTGHPVLDNCIRRTRLLAAMHAAVQRSSVLQMQRIHLMQSRDMTLAYLQLLEDVALDTARRRIRQCCEPETDALRAVLRRCACDAASGFVYRLECGRYAAEIYTRQRDFPFAPVQKLLQRQLGVTLRMVQVQHLEQYRYSFYEEPVYSMQCQIRSIHAPSYERCGDNADVFEDSAGNCYLILSDGMGSGSTASLASRIAVRTFRRMVGCGMEAATAIRLVNTILMTETSTENFATLDILKMDADSGELTLWKSGAAATLFYHSGSLRRIASESFPVGILPEAVPERRHLYAVDGDRIVMLSDGISEAEYPFIRELLSGGVAAEELIGTILEKADIFHGGSCRDDMTVIVGQVRLSNLLKMTKTDITMTKKDGQVVVNNSEIMVKVHK